MAKNYQKFRPQLRELFNYKCAYCETAEPELLTLRLFHIDHYKPQKKFKYLVGDYNNLIYSCYYCNENKGDYWPSSYFEQFSGKIVINRRVDKLTTHLDMSTNQWKGITRCGKWTVSLLQLDSRRQIRLRERKQLKLGAIKTLDFRIKQLNQILTNAMSQNANAEEIEQIQQEILMVQAQRDSLQNEVTGQLSE